MSLLDSINSPQDLKALDQSQLPILAREIRQFMVQSVSKTGGHLASSLGAVELTLALNYVFDSPKDKIVYDVGHQTYAHKIITGRKDRFSQLRQFKGLSGFPKRFESEHDVFGTAHSSTSISAALGMAVSDALHGDKDSWHIAVIGDGALTGGMAIEALNHAGTYQDGLKLLVIVNDNDCSISPSVGALNHHLTTLVSSSTFNHARSRTKDFLRHIPGLWRFVKSMEQRTVNFVAPHSTLFSAFDLNYYGPVNGHDLDLLIKVLKNIKRLDGPMVLHVSTVKGKGYAKAEADPTLYHGVQPFDPNVGIVQKKSDPDHPTFTQVFSRWVCDMAAQDPELYAITPAMREGSGLVEFEKRYPERYRDVAIAEQHAVTYAAGLAAEGMHPVVALYSSFAQRAYDQILHDVAIQNLPVTFAIDRGGLVGADGETHHGVFDIAFMRSIPNMTIMLPSDENECRQMLTQAVRLGTPAVVRYPRGKGIGAVQQEALTGVQIGKARMIRESTRTQKRVAILAFGPLLWHMKGVAERLDATLVDMRFVKPMDEAMIAKVAANHDLIVTIEDGVVAGGAGSAVLETLSRLGIPKATLLLGIDDVFVGQGSVEQLMAEQGLSQEAVERRIRAAMGEKVCEIREYVELKALNTMHVDAVARYYTQVHGKDELQAALEWAKAHSVKPFILGGGANTLFTRRLIDRLVIKMDVLGIETVAESEQFVFVKAGAGENWPEFVKTMIEQNRPGLENLALIPGTVGASVVQNIGAYGSEVAQWVKEVEVYRAQSGECETLLARDCDFGYRHSLFKTEAAAHDVVLSVTFALPKHWQPNLSYKELKQRVGETPTAKAVFDAVVAIRSAKLPDPAVLGSAGSFFKNPVVDQATYLSLLQAFPNLVHYDVGGGQHKLAAGWMIDQAGLKGWRQGDVGTYEKQALVLVNHGQARGEELLAGAEWIQSKVKEKFGVTLEPEPVLVD